MHRQELNPEPLSAIMKINQSNEMIFIDPVCHKAVKSDNKDTTLTYQLRTYYFCSPACRKAFEKNPGKYLDLESHRGKGFWIRYLDRLKQVAGQKIF